MSKILPAVKSIIFCDLMDPRLRIVLVVASALLILYTVRKIRKAQLEIDDAIFWIAFPALLVLLSVFPHIAFYAAKLLKIESPANFIFALVIALVLGKLFLVSVEVSVQKRRLSRLVQAHALAEKERADEKKTESDGENAASETPTEKE